MTFIIAEHRYILSSAKVPGVLDALDDLRLGETKFPQPYNHTLYFDTKSPTSRARRYADNPLKIRVDLGFEKKWFYETKTNEPIGAGWLLTVKTRQEETDLADVVRKADAALITATSYKRRHFSENDQEGAVRVTLDDDVQFFQITESESEDFTMAARSGVLGGKEGAIIEIKSPPKKASSPLSMAIQSLLRQTGAKDSASKRDRAEAFSRIPLMVKC